MAKTVLFYSSVSNKDLFKTQKFYQTDIAILKKMGYNVLLSNKIHDALKFYRYDFVFAYFYRKSFFVALIARLYNKNTYFTGGIDDLDKDYASRKRYLIQSIFFKLCYALSKSCIIVSQSDLHNIKRLYKRDTILSKLKYSEHTIDTEKYCYNGDKELIFTTIAWMGDPENVRRKGVDIAIKLFACIHRDPDFKNAKFYIIGRHGEGTQIVKYLIDQYNLWDSVQLTGEISEEEKIRYLQRSKYYFQLSLYEGFGVAALEALCANNIVIHSGKGGLSNNIFKSGILFNIDSDFDSEYTKLIQSIKSFKQHNLTVTSKCICDKYSNNRRENDFISMIKE